VDLRTNSDYSPIQHNFLVSVMEIQCVTHEVGTKCLYVTEMLGQVSL